MTDSEQPPLTVDDLRAQVRYLREHLTDRIDDSPHDRGKIAGARGAFETVEHMLDRVVCDCEPYS